MKDGFKVIDADRHILEPSDLYQKYLPEKFKKRVHLAGPNPDRSRSRWKAGFGFGAPAGPDDGRSRLHLFVVETMARMLRRRLCEQVRPGVEHPRHGARRHRCERVISDHRSLHYVARRYRSGAQRRHLPGLQHLVSGILRLRSQAAVRRHAYSAAGSGPRRGRTQVCAREIGFGGHLLAAQQILRPDVCQPGLLSNLRDRIGFGRNRLRTRGRPHRVAPGRAGIVTANSAAISLAIRWSRCSPVSTSAPMACSRNFPS